MPLKYKRQRWYNRIYLFVKNSLHWHNFAVFTVSAILLTVVTPILLVTFFSSAYASEVVAEEVPTSAAIFATTSLVSLAELEQKFMLNKTTKVYIFHSNPSYLTESASALDSLEMEIEFMPDYGATSLPQFCKNLANQKVKELTVLGSKFEVMQISYACENFGINPVNIVYKQAQVTEYMSAGFDLLGLIFELNFRTD